MPDDSHKTAPSRVRKWVTAAGIVLVALLVILAAAVYFGRPQLNRWVSAKLVDTLSQTTGGRVEVQSIEFNLWQLRFDLHQLTIHGLEPASEPPYIRMNRAQIELSLLSLLERRIGLRNLEVDRPMVHITIDPGGTTNVPPPRGRGTSLNELFQIVIGQIVLRDGQVDVNDRTFPLHLKASDLLFVLNYAAPEKRYDGAVTLGHLDLNYDDLPQMGKAEATFSLSRAGAQLRSLKILSGDSSVSASGELNNWARPNVEISYKASLDVQQLSRISRTPQLRRGQAVLDGRAKWSSSNFEFAGKADGQNLAYEDTSLRISNASVSFEYQATQEKIALPHISASVLGGDVTGDLQITGPLVGGSPSNSGTGTRRRNPPAMGEEQRSGTVNLRIRALSLARLVAAISTRDMPLDRAHWAGNIDGIVDGRWAGDFRNLIATIQANVRPPVKKTGEELPVTATLRGVYDGRASETRIQELAFSTPGSRLHAVGEIGRSVQMNMEWNTTDLGEWQTLLVSWNESAPLPVDLHGSAAFQGAVTGARTSPEIAGHLSVLDFDALLPARSPAPSPASTPSPTGPRRLHWDSAEADISYSHESVAVQHGTLKHGRATVSVDFSTRLEHGRWTTATPFDLKATIRNAEASEALGLAGYSYPITGTLDVTERLSGTQSDLRGNADVSLSKGELFGEPYQRLSCSVRFVQGGAEFTDVRLTGQGVTVTGSGAYDWMTTAFRFSLQGTNIELAKLHRLQNPRLTTAGLLNFTATGEGTRSAPVVNVRAQLVNLAMGGERVGNFNLQAVTTGDLMRVSIHPEIENSSLTADGTVRLRDDYPLNMTVRLNRLDFDPLLRAFLKGHVTAHSALAGTISLAGPLRTPKAIRVDGDIQTLSAEIEHMEVHNETPLHFAYEDEVLRLDDSSLGGTHESFSVRGRMQLRAPQTMFVTARGTVDLQLLRMLDPNLVAYGKADFNVRLGGQITQPELSGEVNVLNAGISYPDLPNGLGEMNGRLTFAHSRLQIVNLAAKTGGGTVDISGYLDYGQELAFNLNAVGRDIRLRYPPGVSSVANTNLRLTGGSQTALLSGDITLTRFGISPQFDFSQYLAHGWQELGAIKTSPKLPRLRLDIHVVSTPELQFQTSLARLSGDVDLRLRGTANQPVVLGRIDIVEGVISLNGTQYRLQRGDITFNNPVRVDPVLDIQATTTVQRYEVTLGFHGPISRLSSTYRSDPPLASADIVSLLAFGRTREESTAQQGQSPFPGTASYAILNQALNAAVSSRMQKIFGVSRIKIDPQPQVSGVAYNAAGPTVTIEQQVANKLTITYISNLSRANYQIIQAEYSVSHNLSLIAVRDWNGVVSFDFRIRRRKR